MFNMLFGQNVSRNKHAKTFESGNVGTRWALCKHLFGDMNQLEQLCKMSRSKLFFIVHQHFIVADVAGSLPRIPNGRARSFLEGPGQNLERKFPDRFSAYLRVFFLLLLPFGDVIAVNSCVCFFGKI